MCGPHDGILGRRVDRVLAAAVSFVPHPFDVSEGDVRLSGAIVECSPENGRAAAIQRVMWREADIEAMARGLGDHVSRAELRQRVVATYARWQRIPERTANQIFARTTR